jgi:hypothetical protein
MGSQQHSTVAQTVLLNDSAAIKNKAMSKDFVFMPSSFLVSSYQTKI